MLVMTVLIHHSACVCIIVGVQCLYSWYPHDTPFVCGHNTLVKWSVGQNTRQFLQRWAINYPHCQPRGAVWIFPRRETHSHLQEAFDDQNIFTTNWECHRKVTQLKYDFMASKSSTDLWIENFENDRELCQWSSPASWSCSLAYSGPD